MFCLHVEWNHLRGHPYHPRQEFDQFHRRFCACRRREALPSHSVAAGTCLWPAFINGVWTYTWVHTRSLSLPPWLSLSLSYTHTCAYIPSASSPPCHHRAARMNMHAHAHLRVVGAFVRVHLTCQRIVGFLDLSLAGRLGHLHVCSICVVNPSTASHIVYSMQIFPNWAFRRNQNHRVFGKAPAAYRRASWARLRPHRRWIQPPSRSCLCALSFWAKASFPSTSRRKYFSRENISDWQGKMVTWGSKVKRVRNFVENRSARLDDSPLISAVPLQLWWKRGEHGRGKLRRSFFVRTTEEAAGKMSTEATKIAARNVILSARNHYGPWRVFCLSGWLLQVCMFVCRCVHVACVSEREIERVCLRVIVCVCVFMCVCLYN